MQLFSEIYSAYYAAVCEILSEETVTEKQMSDIISANAFAESSIYLMPKLKEQWQLIKSDGCGNYTSNLKKRPHMPMTLLEKRWLRAVTDDKRIRLFLDDDTLNQLKSELKEYTPLYDNQHFYMFDCFNDGDDYTSDDYIKNFRTIRKAISSKEILIISYNSPGGSHITHRYLPIAIEYSAKNDKFRVYCAQLKSFRAIGYSTINMSRICDITETSEEYAGNIDISRIFESKRCNEPACLKISPDRNCVERFMTEFAGYEKQTEVNQITGYCTAQLWYDKQDETEILIRLLAYGPMLEILSPASLRRQAKKRIDRQYDILFNEK